MANRPSVTPAKQRVGRVEVEVSLGPIARMFAAEEWQQPENAGGGAVFAGRAGEVRENVAREDPASAPPDQFNFDAKYPRRGVRAPGTLPHGPRRCPAGG